MQEEIFLKHFLKKGIMVDFICPICDGKHNILDEHFNKEENQIVVKCNKSDIFSLNWQEDLQIVVNSDKYNNFFEGEETFIASEFELDDEKKECYLNIYECLSNNEYEYLLLSKIKFDWKKFHDVAKIYESNPNQYQALVAFFINNTEKLYFV